MKRRETNGLHEQGGKHPLSKLKIGLFGIVAALLFALPGAFGIGGGLSPVFAARDGDICALLINRALVTTGGVARYQVDVGDTFDAFARVQDNFEAKFRIDFDDDGEDPPSQVDRVLLMEALVNVWNLSWEVDSQTGEAKITDRIEDDQDATHRWVFYWAGGGTNGGDSGLPSSLAPHPDYGEAERNIIPPIDIAENVDILTVWSFAGADDDLPGDADSDDIRNFFVERGPTAADRTAAEAALTDCGSSLLSIDGFSSADFSFGDQVAIWNLMISCELGLGGPADWDDCEALDNWFDNSGDGADGFDDVQVALSLDGWSEISITCTKPGEVKISVDPTNEGALRSRWDPSPESEDAGDFPDRVEDTNGQVVLDDEYFDLDSPDNSELEGRSIDVECIGTSHTATVSASPTTVEIKPVGTSVSLSTVVVTVYDANGKRLDGAEVTFSVNNCSVGTSATGPFAKEVVTSTDTDSSGDVTFATQHSAAGDELAAGTAEAYVQCSASGTTAGSVVVTYVVDTIGITSPSTSGLSGTTTITVVGPPAALRLEVTPATSVCGNPVTATATVVDSTGKPVSDGTQVFFTAVSSTGGQGGSEGAQGGASTTNGVASVSLSINPQDAGTHTVSARTGGNDLTGAPVAVVSNVQTISCTLAVSAAPTISAPRTGTGDSVSGIRPPNTGDAGLVASQSGSSTVLFALAAGVFALSLGLALKLARR
jgi:hypothetical protein